MFCVAAFPSSTARGCVCRREGPSSAEIALAEAEARMAMHF